jgi:hypothetical protein
VSDAGSPRHSSPASQRGLTGAATAFVVVFALCQSPVRNLGRTQAQAPSCPTGPPTTPSSPPSCGWLRPTPSSSCASARLAAATTASPGVECRPIRPVRADPPAEIIHTTTTTGTTTINPAKGRAWWSPLRLGRAGSRAQATRCTGSETASASYILQHDDHRWPRPGDVVECEIEGMGMIWNISV